MRWPIYFHSELWTASPYNFTPGIKFFIEFILNYWIQRLKIYNDASDARQAKNFLILAWYNLNYREA